MKVDILIVHLNGEKIISECLESIYKNTKVKGISLGVKLLLNNTKDNSAEIVRQKFPKVEITKTEKTIGFAEASNILAKKSEADYIVFLNNDVVVEKDWLKEMLATVKRNKNCVGCQPKIISHRDRNKFEYAGAAGGFIDKYGYPFARGRIFNFIEEDKRQYDDETRVFWACGVCFLVDRKFFMESGMFDEKLFMYAEETDFCWRANILGKELWYSPKAKIYHIGSYTIDKQKFNLKKDYLLSRNHIIIMLKNYSAGTLIGLLPMKIILELISGARFFPNKTLAVAKTLLFLPFEYFLWIKNKRNIVQRKRKISDDDISHLIYDKSIALNHFLNGKNKFSEIKLGKH